MSKPKTFSLHWGSGVIEFCHDDLKGRFQRSPLILDATDVPRLGRALRRTPKLRRLLARLIG
jgi:hypothetical protein